MSRLSSDAIAAAAAGMSYGYWKVLHPTTAEVFSNDCPACLHCGKRFKPINGTKYCSDECRVEVQRIRAREHYHKKKATALGGKND